MLSLAFPPVDAWPLAFLAPIPLFVLLPEARPGRGALLGAAFGVAFYGATLSWILLFGEMAWVAISLLCGASATLFGALAPLVTRRGGPILTSVGLASLWTVVDWLRGAWPLGGFTWGSLGASQVEDPVTLRLASVGGVWAVTFAVALVAALLAAALRGAGDGRRGTPVVLAALVGLAPAAIPFPAAAGRALDVAATVVDVRPHRDLSGEDEDRAVATDILAEHRRVLDRGRPDLVVWGESALDPGAAAAAFYPSVRAAVAEGGVPVVAGSIQPGTRVGERVNAVLALDASGDVTTWYKKTHLVPFGEYVPFGDVLRGRISALEQIPYDLTAGEDLGLQRIPGLPAFATPVCFENAFPAIERELVRQGAEFIVVVTNNASYELTAASAQHLQMSQLRAVETGRWVVHAGISGISAFIDPAGRRVASRGLFDAGSVRATIRASTSTTIYVRLGDWVPLLAAVWVLASIVVVPPRRAWRERPGPLGAAPRTLVILPTYEERATIAEVLQGVMAVGSHVQALVIDDGSPDGTADVVRAKMVTEPRIRLVERPTRSGLASAYLLGFSLALNEGHDLIVEMDSDLSHDPAELPGLLAVAGGTHLAVGSRYIPGGSVSNWSRLRVGLSQAGNLYSRLALGLPVRDATSGYRVYRAELLRALTQQPLRSDGYGFQIELALRAYRGGWTVVEHPITFREREHGRSKLSRRIVVEALWLVTRWGVRLRLGRGL
jgi:apolipoprotein N-acyltransferase